MILQYLQHVAFEGPGNVEHWARAHGHEVRATRLHAGEPLPAPADFDLLVVMGGPMNVYEERAHPFLADEKRLVERAVLDGKPLLGICLGAQLIAAVLGARVFRNAQEEIGWFPVELTDEAAASPVFSALPRRFDTFHWHGDTFDLPRGAAHVAASAACANQAFVYGDRVVGVQFHPEVTDEGVRLMLRHEGHEIEDGGEYVQSPREITSPPRPYEENAEVTATILDQLSRAAGGRSTGRAANL